ncbi:MAG: hypothetical protein EZS28_041379 [Streblomastix strix]|uniref:Uncharacterized protein n=1 Tax=Streblomastix strix TaxID=222440 RepID=A0A5J4U087_9EUKA|nr:MAG: hypothetical protein EZS28_041379 [Streblomastix strix]
MFCCLQVAQFKSGDRMLRVVVFISLSSPSCPIFLAQPESKIREDEGSRSFIGLAINPFLQGFSDSFYSISPIASSLLSIVMDHRKLLLRILSMNSIWNYKLEGSV